MLRRRRSRPPLLARVSTPADGGPAARRLTRSQLAAYRGLLRQLGEARVVALTGGGARDFVAVGLATAAVAEARRAVLVEADLMHPGLADRLALAEAPGLGEYLRGQAEAAALLQPLVLAGPVTESPVEHLVCVVAGRPAPDAEALLGSDAFRHAVARLRSAYELVVIEGPPDHRDGSLLSVSAQADMTIACGGEAELREARWQGVAGVVVAG